MNASNVSPQSRTKTREKGKQAYATSSRRWAKSQSFVKVGRKKNWRKHINKERHCGRSWHPSAQNKVRACRWTKLYRTSRARLHLRGMPGPNLPIPVRPLSRRVEPLINGYYRSMLPEIPADANSMFQRGSGRVAAVNVAHFNHREFIHSNFRDSKRFTTWRKTHNAQIPVDKSTVSKQANRRYKN